jgi:hypothetical protein
MSTKIVVGLGMACVLIGFGIAGWQQLAKDDKPDSTSPTAQLAHPYLPDMRDIVLFLAVVVAAILGGAYVLIRARRRRPGL